MQAQHRSRDCSSRRDSLCSRMAAVSQAVTPKSVVSVILGQEGRSSVITIRRNWCAAAAAPPRRAAATAGRAHDGRTAGCRGTSLSQIITLGCPPALCQILHDGPPAHTDCRTTVFQPGLTIPSFSNRGQLL